MSKNSKLSCIIPTYNRCSNKDDVRLNPIWWVADSLFRQDNLEEVIFVDDGSNDHFIDTVEAIKDASPKNVDVKYLIHSSREGSGKSRNDGVALSSNERIFFMDDDCVLIGDDVLPKLDLAYDVLKSEGQKPGILTLPVSSGSLDIECFDSSRIGKVNHTTGEIDGIYMRFPAEYLRNPLWLDEESGIFRPLEIDITGGVFLTEKSPYNGAGGFPTTKWRNASAEEPELMLNMRKNGHKNFYLPSHDSNFGVFHFKYGDPDKSRFKNQEYPFRVRGVSLEDVINSSLKGEGGGNRVDKNEAYYSTILSRIVLIFKHYGNLGFNYLETTYAGLGQDTEKLPLFRRAVDDGLSILEKENLITSEGSRSIKESYLS